MYTCIQRNETEDDEVPILAMSTPRTPEAQDSLPAFDEFPFPPDKERFSDIEDSHGDSSGAFQEPVIPDIPAVPGIPEASPKRPPTEPKLQTVTRTVKPGYFSNGKPIETLRQSRSPKRKVSKVRPQLDAIISENEEELDELSRSRSLIALKSRKTRSPEAAESTRYQTPASPVIVAVEESWRVHPEPRVRGGGTEGGRRLHSPTAADEVQISFMSSESSTETISNHTGDSQGQLSLPSIIPEKRTKGKKRGKKDRENKLREHYDSPYQEILWRRVEADSDNPGRRKKESSQMRRYSSLSPIVKDQRLAEVASQGGLLKRPPHPWY